MVELVNSLVSRIYTVSVLEKVFELFVHLILSTCWVTWFGSEALISSDGKGKLAWTLSCMEFCACHFWIVKSTESPQLNYWKWAKTSCMKTRGRKQFTDYIYILNGSIDKDSLNDQNRIKSVGSGRVIIKVEALLKDYRYGYRRSIDQKCQWRWIQNCKDFPTTILRIVYLKK